MRTMRAVAPMLALCALAACVNGVEPTEAQVRPEVPVLAQYANASGDTLVLRADGTFEALTPTRDDGVTVLFQGKPVALWVHGRWEQKGTQVCARPNRFLYSDMRCGATRAGAELEDPSSVFLWDKRSRTWSVR